MNRKTIIITGSTRGLDLAFVKKFLDLWNNIEQTIKFLSNYKNQVFGIAGTVEKYEFYNGNLSLIQS